MEPVGQSTYPPDYQGMFPSTVRWSWITIFDCLYPNHETWAVSGRISIRNILACKESKCSNHLWFKLMCHGRWIVLRVSILTRLLKLTFYEVMKIMQSFVYLTSVPRVELINLVVNCFIIFWWIRYLLPNIFKLTWYNIKGSLLGQTNDQWRSYQYIVRIKALVRAYGCTYIFIGNYNMARKCGL